MKKILLIILIFVVLYIISIFKLPTFANYIGSMLGLEKINEFIVSFSDKYNDVVTDIPSKEEVLDIYNKTLSGANQIKDTIIKSAESTKGYVDNARLSLSGSSDAISDIKDKIININNTYEDTKDIINDAIDNVGQIQGKIETIGEILSKTGETLTSSGEIITNTGEIN